MRLKNIFKAVAVMAIPAMMIGGGMTSCSDMLEVESSRMVSNPNINNKSDSVFYAYGIMQAMQQLADQYYFQNEMRGDLVTPTAKATTHLKNLADYSVGTENKYDSVYLYYKVINNCNYYLQHRDTTLMSGTKNVTINEFVAVAAFRAWAYLQLTKQYGDVPYVTSPVMSVSEINAKTEHTPYQNILTSQAEYLQKLVDTYSDEFLSVPYYQEQVQIGHLNCNKSANKYISPSKCFVPVRLVLGDIYLEMGEYERAAAAYHDYLLSQAKDGISNIQMNYPNGLQSHDAHSVIEWPLDFNATENTRLTRYSNYWETHAFGGNASVLPGEEIISYIPMAVNYTMGQTTNVPLAFGYDYYATTDNRVARYRIGTCPETNEMQLQPSADYMKALRTNPYYYVTTEKDPNISSLFTFSQLNVGDARGNMIVKGEGEDSTLVFVQKPSSGYFYLYRNTTVFMRLAEALNRMGEPELAFTVLKKGMHSGIEELVDSAYSEDKKIAQENYYIPLASYKRLQTAPLDFFSELNKPYFTNTSENEIGGVHFHGAGAVEDIRSPYTYKAIVEERIEKIRQQFAPEKAGQDYTREEYINAVEDLLCDEYALEFAFEGVRFGDLQRIARHKNADNTYGANFGSVWFADKLKGNNPAKSLLDPNNWYLPFK